MLISSAEIQREDSDAKLHELQHRLVPTWTDPAAYEAQLASYQGFLADSFELEAMKNILADLEKDERYLQWRTSPESSILRLSGQTSTACTGLCWLSSIVPSLVETLRLEGHPVVCHLTQRHHSTVDEVSMHDIISSIMFQLLVHATKARQSREYFNDIHRLLTGKDWCKDLATLSRTLVRVLECFELTYIVLDRLDRATCRGKTPKFIEYLLEALSASKCQTRIILVCKPAAASSWNLDLSKEIEKMQIYFDISEWDQEENALTPRRLNRH